MIDKLEMMMLSFCMMFLVFLGLCAGIFATTVSPYPFNIGFGAVCVPTLLMLVLWIRAFIRDLQEWRIH